MKVAQKGERCTINKESVWGRELLKDPYIYIVFAKGLGDRCSIPDWVKPEIKKMILDTSWHNIQHYKVCINDKVGQSKETSHAFP